MSETYTKKISKREGLDRQPVMEVHTMKVIQQSGNHKCTWVKAPNQTHPTLTAYICSHKNCGRGLMVDEKVDSIDNY